MIPSLAKRGKLSLITSLSFLLVGALYGSPPLVALGGVLVSALLTAYLSFFPTAILLRRRKVELSWWVPPGNQPGGALSVERPFLLHIALRNHGVRTLRVVGVRILGSSSLEFQTDLEAVVPAGKQVEIGGEVRAHAAGYKVIHGAVLVLSDSLSLFEVRAYFPNPLALKVFPRQANVGSLGSLRPRTGALHERVGLHHVHRRGLAGDLREIRDHTHGDPFKFIAWKATARRQKLMVRDLETEVILTHQLLVDMGDTMRRGNPGATKLDYTLDAAAALARAALDSGDRVGLVSFDSRVYSVVPPGSGHHHYLKFLDRLVDLNNVVDEDLTDLSNAELVAAVAKYLAHQEAVDVRIRQAPAHDSSAWHRIHAGPGGELYDMGVMNTLVGSLLHAIGETASHKAMTPAWWWSRVHVNPQSDVHFAKLRLFCRLRGIELPYRQRSEPGSRAAGLTAAVERAAGESRADVIVILSDLYRVAERPNIVAKGLSLARRYGQRVVTVVPTGPSFLGWPRTAAGRRVAEVLAEDERLMLEESTRLFRRSGVGVVKASQNDNAAVLMRKIARMRAPKRQTAA